jgi:hypothetical protein
MAAIIELARAERGNPEVPDWLQEEYFRSIQELAETGAKEILVVGYFEVAHYRNFACR